VKLHRTVAVSTALALFATLSAAGAASAAPSLDQTLHSREVAHVVSPAATTLTQSEFAASGYTTLVTGFRAGEVTITVNGSSLSPVTLDPSGQFTFFYNNGGAVIAPGTYSFAFTQASAGTQNATLVIVADAVPTPSPTPTPTPTPTPAPSCSAVPAVITGSAPTSVSVSGIHTTGLPVTASGFIAGETVDIILGTGQSAGGVGEAVVAADCTVAYSVVVTADIPVGDGYTVTLAGGTGQITFPFAVVADVVASPAVIAAPAAPAPTPRAAVRSSAPQLAATGFEPAAGMLAAAGLLSAGAAAFALRHRWAFGRD
jgi:hypothetical protein